MDSFTFNKIAGGVLGTALFVMVVKIGAEAAFHTEAPEEPAYVVEGVDELEGHAAVDPEPEAAPPDFATAIPAANIANGEAASAICGACHNWEPGGGQLIGPPLYGIVGREQASVDGFNYSAAFQGLDGEWSYAELFRFLEQPAVYAPGTTMAFAGVQREQDRIDLIAYMRTWAENPAPLPPPMPAAEPEAAAVEEAPTEDGAEEEAPE